MRLQDLSWAQRLLLLAALCGLALAVRIVTIGAELPAIRVWVLVVGLCTAWAAALGGLMLLVLTVVERVRRRPYSVVRSAAPLVVVGGVGAGLATAMGALLYPAYDANHIGIAVAGVAAVAAAVHFRRRPPVRLLASLGLLVAAIAAFQIPREQGVYSLHWKTWETMTNWSWSGGENCNGTNLGDQPLAIAPYRPDYQLVPELSGPLGTLVNESIGSPSPEQLYRPGVAEFRITGDLDYGDLSCHVPLFRSDRVEGSFQVVASYHRTNDPQSFAELRCTNNHTLSYTIDLSTKGVASCRDIGTEIAGQIAAQIHTHARTVCGYGG